MSVSSNLFQVDKTVTKRESSWICVCDECQHERVITYSQSWNITKGKSSITCKPCNVRLGRVVLNLTGLSQGRKYWKKNKKVTNRGISYNNLFREVSEETRKKQSLAKLDRVGPLCNAYIDGRTPINKRLRSTAKYRSLRKEVFKRDDYTCQMCLDRGGELNMDHIKEWCNYPDLRFELTNCRTLCIDCHKKTDNYKHKAVLKRKNLNGLQT